MNDLDGLTLLGLAAGFCTTASFLPQVIKTIKSRHTRDISLLMYIVLTLGLFLWLLYGLLLRDIPLILANGISFSLSFLVLFLKIRHRGS
jgi:MtN3 and saliva related transmembrane protein